MRVAMADFRKSKDKVLYRKKGNIPEGLYIWALKWSDNCYTIQQTSCSQFNFE
jgi:hypothetical protein